MACECLQLQAANPGYPYPGTAADTDAPVHCIAVDPRRLVESVAANSLDTNTRDPATSGAAVYYFAVDPRRLAES